MPPTLAECPNVRIHIYFDECIFIITCSYRPHRATQPYLGNLFAKILQSPELSHIEKIQLSEDNSVVKIQRPGWNKPWSISKKELKAMLEAYFNSTSTCSSDDCFDFIVNSSKERLVSTEFNFTRVKND